MKLSEKLGMPNAISFYVDNEKEILQAKEMEKEQHGKTWDKSMDNLDSRGGNMVRAWVDFDEHYNETYGGGEQWATINNKQQ